MADQIEVVLAEDQVMVLGAFAELLDIQPDIAVVASVNDGTNALAPVGQHRPSVLLTDIEMPGCSGLGVAERLHCEGSATRVLIVTTFARGGYLRRAMEAGALDTSSRR